jgi:hypothetical protein
MSFCIETRESRRAGWAIPLALVALFSLFLFGAARAEGAERVLLIAPAEPELLARILGQTQDLGVSLDVTHEPLPQDADSARVQGRARGAAIVVWSQARGSAGFTLYVLEVDGTQLRTREVSTPEKETLASSTTAEMAALVVRSELSALLSEIRAKNELNAASRVPSPGPAQPAARTQASATEGQPTTAPPMRPWAVTVAYRPSLPFPKTFAHGFALGVRRDLSRFAVGLSGIGALPLSLSQDATEIRIHRLQIRLEGLMRFPLLSRLELALGLAASVGFDFRSTEKVAPSMVGTADATTVSGAFGLLGQLEWRFSDRVGTVLGLGADAVPWRTKFVYEDGQGGGVVARLSWLEAWALLGLSVRFGA